MDSYFEKGVRLHGTLSVNGSVHFDGYFEGEIFSSNHFVVGKAGKVLGNIKTYNVTNKGNIQGNIYAENKVALIEDSRLTGDIATYRLVVDEGSNFEGRCKMIEIAPSTIKEELETLERPLPSKTKKTSQIIKTTIDEKNSGIQNNNIGIFAAILIIAGIIWYII